MPSTPAEQQEISGAKRRIVERLKRADTATAPELAAEFGLTDTAIRQHLEALESAQLVRRTIVASAGRGRPPVHWMLTPRAAELFPDRHSDLSVELIHSIVQTLGADALELVINARRLRQLDQYRQLLAGAVDGDVAVRVRRLADARTAEGYLAEVVEAHDAVTLIEHHCPIRDAAGSCGRLCSAELELFSDALGPGVSVTREQHVLSGDQRCSYRIAPAA